ncbi:MAG: hypothetical protein AAFU64_04360, partial [Bacteroidota bacterium]
MNTVENWRIAISLCSGLAVGQSILLGIYLLRKKARSPLFFLGILLIGLALRVGKSFFYYAVPSLSFYSLHLGAFGLLLIGPSLWIFILRNQFPQLSYDHYFHYLPAFLYLIFGTLIFPDEFMYTYAGGSHVLFFYLLASFFQARKLNWTQNILGFRVIFWGLGGIWLSLEYQMWGESIISYTIGSALICILLYTLNFYIMGQPQVFRFKIKNTPSRGALPIRQELVEDLEKLFGEKEFYRKKGLTLAEVGQALNTPTYLISQAIKGHYSLKFNDFVNKYRVEEVKNRRQDFNLCVLLMILEAI